jgi:HAD superfamily hydrolase (TIGR01490 family)
MEKRPFAVLDIDGTLIRWQLYHALADELVKAGHLDPKIYQSVKTARMNWKKRTNELSFTEYEEILVGLIDSVIPTVNVADFEAACTRVITVYKDQVYTYTRDLIHQLQVKNYLLFAISASQQEIVKMLAGYYGFTDAGGSVYEIKDGRFTGKTEILKSERKPNFLQELVDKHDATYAGSIGVGDSESDIPMLSKVEQPIAFNPTKELLEHARRSKWQVVIERKNVVYKLEPKDGSYILAAPGS